MDRAIIFTIQKLIKRYLKAKLRAPAYSRVLHYINGRPLKLWAYS